MKINLLILGGGAIVLQCHLPALLALDCEHTCTVVDPNLDNLKLIISNFKNVKILNVSYDDCSITDLFISSFDCVLVALPNSLHYKACQRCVMLRIPVLCEKPLALTSCDYQKLIEICTEFGSPVFVAMVRRFIPSITLLQRVLASDMLGQIKSVSLFHGGSASLWPWDTDTVLRKDQGGCLINMGIHFLDYLTLLFGELIPIKYYDDYRGGIEVNCKIFLKTLSDIPVRIEISWTHSLQNKLYVEGEKCNAIIDLNKFGSISIENSKLGFSGDISGDKCFNSGNWNYSFESCFVEQFWYFFKYVHEYSGENKLVTPKISLMSHKIIEWCYDNRSTLLPTNTKIEYSNINTRPSLEPADVAVTGGTGFIGKHLIERLCELNMTSVSVLVKHNRTGSEISRFPITMVKINLFDVNSCRSALNGKKHVFHLAYGNSGNNDSKVTIIGTRNILNASLLEGVQKIVVFSTCSVWDGYDGLVVDEEFAFKSCGSDYARSKSIMHAETLKFSIQHPDIVISIICPGAVYGPEGSLFVKMPIDSARDGSFFWVDNGSGRCNYVYVDNLVDATIFCVQNSNLKSDHYIVVDGTTSWWNFLTPLVTFKNLIFPSFSVKNLNNPFLFVDLPPTLKMVCNSILKNPDARRYFKNKFFGKIFIKFLLKFRANVGNATLPDNSIIPKFNKKTAIYNSLVCKFFNIGGPIYSSKKISKQLGWDPLISLNEGIDRSKNWYFNKFKH